MTDARNPAQRTPHDHAAYDAVLEHAQSEQMRLATKCDKQTKVIADLVAALRRYREVSHYILTHIDFRSLPEALQRDAEQCDDQARAALARATDGE